MEIDPNAEKTTKDVLEEIIYHLLSAIEEENKVKEEINGSV